MLKQKIVAASQPHAAGRSARTASAGALVGFAERIAGDGRGEAALRADRDRSLSMKARASSMLFEQIVCLFERRAFRADEASTRPCPRDETQRREIAGARGVEFEQKWSHRCAE